MNYKNEWEERIFWIQKYQKYKFYKKKHLRYMTQMLIKHQLLKKNHMEKIRQLNISLDIMKTMALDLYV